MAVRSGMTMPRVCKPGKGQRATYDAIIRAYEIKHQTNALDEIRFYFTRKSLSDAVQLAATARREDGSKHSHQWRIPNQVLKRFASRLHAIQKEIKRAQSFHSLWSLVRREGNQIKGIGELTVYDTAHRIGAFLGMEPDFIYLHAGTRMGAKALGLNVEGSYMVMSLVPVAFRRLKAHEIEDCLCIYKAQFAAMRVGE